MPTPRDDESKDEFIERCMGDSEAKEDFPDNDQRLAFCNSQWDNRKDEPMGHMSNLDCDIEAEIVPDPALETRLNLELRAEQDTRGPKLIGMGAVFDRWSEDLGGFQEIIRRGAFDATLENASNDIRALVGHDPEKVLGRRSNNTLRLRTTQQGLKVTIRPPKTSFGKDIVESVSRGDIDGMSIGFRIPPGGDRVWLEDDMQQMRRELTAIDLREVSVVAFPAYADTSVANRSIEAFRKNKLSADDEIVIHSTCSKCGKLSTEIRLRRDAQEELEYICPNCLEGTATDALRQDDERQKRLREQSYFGPMRSRVDILTANS